MTKSKYLASFTSTDLATGVFLTCLSVTCIVFSSRVESWPLLVLINTALTALIFVGLPQIQKSSPRWLRLTRDWYPVPMIFLVFKETYQMVHPIHPQDFDWLLIQIDRSLLGTDPTRWLLAHSNPVMTEILQVSYTCYYVILVSVFFELDMEKRHTEYFLGAFLVVYGFYLSYAGYFLLPAVGPRFALHDFGSLNSELPGLWLTNGLRDFVNAGESIPKGVARAVDYAQRDAFPSGHTQLTLVILYIAFTSRLKSRWVLLVVGSLLIISTVYLRYHYVIDVFVGVLFFLFTIWSGKKIDAWWRERKLVFRSEALSDEPRG